MATDELAIVLIVVVQVFATVLALALYASRYKRVPPNKAMVVCGRKERSGSSFAVIVGGGKFILPIVESYAFFSVESVNVATKIPGSGGARIKAVVQPTLDADSLKRSATRLLGKTSDEIGEIAATVLEAQTQRVLADSGSGTSWSEVAARVRERAAPELKTMGLEFVGNPSFEG